MICVLDIIEGPASGMKCWLRNDQKVTVGRVSNADLSIPNDPHLSRNHLVVEGISVGFRLRDAGSSNGTFVNDMPVSVVQLCPGDQIRAGGSLFQVELLADQRLERGDKGVAVTPNIELPAVPNRTFSAGESLAADQDLTQRFLDQRTASYATTDQQQSNEAGLTEPNSGQVGLENSTRSSAAAGEAIRRQTPMRASQHIGHSKSTGGCFGRETLKSTGSGVSDSPHEAGRERSSKGILELLVPVEGRRLRYLRGDRGSWQVLKVLESVIASFDHARLSLVVNRAQLPSAEAGVLDFSLNTGESRPLTENIFLLQSDRLDFTMDFFKRCLGRDATICIASPNKLKDGWLGNNIDLLSYPSLLHSVIHEAGDRETQLLSGVQFLFFEINNRGDLCLLS